jgi:hypothetical protein
MPVELIDHYQTVATELKQHKVDMACVRFSPVLNDELLEFVGRELKTQAQTMIDGPLDEVVDLVNKGQKIWRSDGQASRMEKVCQAEALVQSNSKLVGDWSEHFKQAAAMAKTRIAEAAIKQHS